MFLALILRRLMRAGTSRWFQGAGGEWLLLAGACYLVGRSRMRKRRTLGMPVRPGERLMVTLRDPRN